MKWLSKILAPRAKSEKQVREGRFLSRWHLDADSYLGFPSRKARAAGWVAPSMAYPSGFVPMWDFGAWRSCCFWLDQYLLFTDQKFSGGVPKFMGWYGSEGAVCVATALKNEAQLGLFKTDEYESPHPPAWALLCQPKGKNVRHLGFFKWIPDRWEFRPDLDWDALAKEAVV